MTSIAYTGGSTEEERLLTFPCDGLLDAPDVTLFRALTVAAPVSMMFRWLCQLSVAPYAIDPLDNPAFYAGRPSPRVLTPGAEHLARGQVFMTMFRLADFETDRHITLRSHRFHSLFGDVGVTYLVLPREEGSRVVVKLVGAFEGYPVARLLAPPLAWVDLVMMQCQLRRLRRHAERDGRHSARV